MKKWVRRLERHKRGSAVRKKRFFRAVHVATHMLVWAALASICVQLAYPGDRTLPFAQLDNVDVGMMNRSEVMRRLERVAERAELTIATPARERTVQWATIGITVDREATMKSVIEYDWWERLVPFSMPVRMAMYHHTPLVIVDKERLKTFAETIVKEDRLPAKESGVQVVNGQVRIDGSRAGFAFTQQEVERQLQTVAFATDAKVALTPEVLKLRHDRSEVMMVAERAEKLLTRQLAFEFAGRTVTPDSKQVGEWLQVKEDATSRKLVLTVDRAKLKAYLKTVNKQYARPAGTTYVTLLDGQEIARQEGAVGRAMNVETAAKKIEVTLLGAEEQPLAIPVESLQPGVSYKRTYSEANSGLQALIQDWERTTYGDFGVVIQEIGGRNRRAEWQADKQFVTASTYKMFLAYAVLSKIEDGEIQAEQRTDMDWTVDACLNEMIVNSTNPCAISLQNLVGWEETDRMVHGAGFTDTHLNNNGGGEKYTTVRDEATFLQKLDAGVLLSEQGSKRLLDLLKRQIWRGGIPAGVPAGTVVANKVGFYNGWVHDVAIVYGLKSTYVLAIMSKGGSDPGFADLSQRVYNFFAQ